MSSEAGELAFLPPGRIRTIVGREVEGARETVRAIVVAGSYARAEALPGSDLDLYFILADGEPSAFSAGDVDGVFVERIAFDEGTARRKIASEPMAWATFLDGRAVRDDGVFAGLRNAAMSAAASWQPDPESVRACAHWLRSAVVKVEAALDAGEEERAAFAAVSSSFELARGIFLANGRPIVAAGAAWRELRRLPERPDAEVLDAILLAPDVRRRCEAFVVAARWTLLRL